MSVAFFLCSTILFHLFLYACSSECFGMGSLDSVFLKLVFYQEYYRPFLFWGKKTIATFYKVSHSHTRMRWSVISPSFTFRKLPQLCIHGFLVSVTGWITDWICHVVDTPLELALDVCAPEFAQLLASGVVDHFWGLSLFRKWELGPDHL